MLDEVFLNKTSTKFAINIEKTARFLHLTYDRPITCVAIVVGFYGNEGLVDENIASSKFKSSPL